MTDLSSLISRVEEGSELAPASVRPEPWQDIIGFSGTRTGMTRAQIDAVYTLLEDTRGGVGHHGDCVGADVDFHGILRNLGGWRIVVHPPIKTTLRAYCEADEWASAQPYLVRNMDIVNECKFLIATPRDNKPAAGGTWFTVRRAALAGRVGAVVWPDGEVISISRALENSKAGLADANSKDRP